ncbi:hypothetical protein ACP275_04G110000 [Erythranthe tilingii]
MSGAEEEWVRAAITDDTMVAEFLVRLHGAAPPPPSKPAALPRLEWSVRQRRSRVPVAAVNNNHPKKHHEQRASPTTPLSWSGATSPSGGSAGSGGAAAVDGREDSSGQPARNLAATTRSKVNGDSEKTGLKRSRKKKTLAELKDEENSLIKERRELKREIVALRVNLEKERATNESLKRMKIELQPRLDREKISDQLQQKTTDNDINTQKCSTSNNDVAGPTFDPKFVLPDLNIAFEEEPLLSC